MNWLEEFENILKRQRDTRRQREDVAYEQAVQEKEATKRNIAALSNSGLLAFVVTWIGSSDPRMTQLNSELRDYAVQEALRRMDVNRT